MERAASQAQAAERCSWLALGRRAIRRPPDRAAPAWRCVVRRFVAFVIFVAKYWDQVDRPFQLTNRIKDLEPNGHSMDSLLCDLVRFAIFAIFVVPAYDSAHGSPRVFEHQAAWRRHGTEAGRVASSVAAACPPLSSSRGGQRARIHGVCVARAEGIRLWGVRR